MQLIKKQEYGGERPLYASEGLDLRYVTIHPGESSIKECHDIDAHFCRFEGKYVFWETDRFAVFHSLFTPEARSSVWYSKNCAFYDCQIDAPKMFRRTSNITLSGCHFSDAQETLWDCDGICINDCDIANCDYLAMHASDIYINHYRQDGNYSFQYARNVKIHNAVINSKDAFWESENVLVEDSEINGEYLGWYAKNLHLVRCHLSGTQLLCYVDGLTLEDCTFDADADLLFEYSTVNGNILGDVTSIKNPTSGSLHVSGKVGQYIIDSNQKAPADFELHV